MDSDIRVMLVDDHVVLREGLRLLLERQPGLRVVGEAGDGETALALVEGCSPHVVVMDIAMPGMDGLQTTRKLLERHPDVKVLVLTNYDEDEYVMALLQAGAAGYLLKSAGVDELVSAIRSVHAGGSPLPPAIARKVVDSYVRLERTKRTRWEPEPFEQLTPRELEVLKQAAAGLSNQRIAETLCLSLKTVENYMSTVYEKLGVQDRTQAVLYALKKGLVKLSE